MAKTTLKIEGTDVTTTEPEQSSEVAETFADADTVVIAVCDGSYELLDGLVREAAKILSDGIKEPARLMNPTRGSSSEVSRMIRQLTPIATHFDGRTRVIVPVLWNPVRLSEYERLEVPDLLRPFSVNFLMDGLNVSCATILTIPLGANLLVQAGLGVAAAFFIVCVVLAPWFALVIFCAAMADLHAHSKGAFIEVSVSIASFSVLCFVRTFNRFTIYLGGIWRYVGARSAMASVEAELIRLLDETATHARRANLVLLGYGLGGVLAAQALLRVTPQKPTHNRLALVTVAAPLALLTWWFPRRFQSAQTLALEYESAATVKAWLNLWRDRDLIAGPVRVERPTIIETSIGDGFHRDTLNSEALWTHVRDIARALENNSLPALRIAWTEVALTETEIAHLARLEQLLFVKIGFRYTTHMLICNVITLVSTFFIRCPIGTRWLIGSTISAIIILWAGIAYTFAYNSLPRISQRERFGNLRLVLTAVVYGMYLIGALTGIGFLSVAWGAVHM